MCFIFLVNFPAFQSAPALVVHTFFPSSYHAGHHNCRLAYAWANHTPAGEDSGHHLFAWRDNLLPTTDLSSPVFLRVWKQGILNGKRSARGPRDVMHVRIMYLDFSFATFMLIARWRDRGIAALKIINPHKLFSLLSCISESQKLQVCNKVGRRKPRRDNNVYMIVQAQT